ncbi:DUF3810 domain-containing protein [Chitinophaga agrisoli]|uniref:DUF3810 domain-containing protein n=1 Tax=Chitinophaga agrisoli TaxID=2607653 RepID=A0A5B2VMA5_9BACT|nr:DUF3810 domain-containing protein [Chitinophaga agrisoli]KAA2239770.1 DUF3810 domain-containing protein [Chitinophaga agrisoli]
MEKKAILKRSGLRIAIAVALLLLFKLLFAVNDGFASFYFHRLYIWISALFRWLTGAVPFSVGDLIYIGWAITALIFLLKLCYKMIRGRWKDAGLSLLGATGILLTLFFAFLFLWGYNYRRHSLAKDTALNVKPYNTDQLYRLADTLVQEVNLRKAALGDTASITSPDPDSARLFHRAIHAYGLAAQTWPALKYTNPSVKSSLFGRWINYMGVTGYLNPFTNEAQVNTTVPFFTQPFTTCHEIAHQLGYAPEETANFVGYLVADHTPDKRFRYAASFEMFLYSTGQLARRDTALARQVWSRAVPGVKEDYKYVTEFYRSFRGPLDDYSAILYDQYLKANKQEKGIYSYSEVVGWLIAYFKI